MRFCFALICLAAFSSAFSKENSKDVAIRGIILVDHPDQMLRQRLEDCCGVFFRGLCPPGNPACLQQALSDEFLGQVLCQGRLLAIEEAILQHYYDNHRPLVLVLTPEQEFDCGVVQIVVFESRIGQVCYEGNCWFSDALLEQNLCLHEGGYYDADAAQKDLLWLNRSPFRNSYLILNPGVEEGTTDITICTEDKRPYRLFVGGDNTGLRATGRYRLFTGIQIANLFGLDQTLSYQYTVSPDWGRFYAHTGVYKIPLPWRNILEFYGGYSGIRALMPLDVMTHKGRAWQASVRYLIPLTPWGDYSHELRWGLDYKQTDVNLLFGGVPILGNKAVITQGLFGYSGAYDGCQLRTSFDLSLFVSPGGIFPHQSRASYESLRPFAKSRYLYLRFTTTPIYHLPRCWDLVTRLDFQVASQNLLSSEQFGLGGLYTVRGYDERILNTDNGLLLSGELRTPPFRFITRRRCQELCERGQFFAFLDYGFGTDHKALPGVKNFRYLFSTGVGLLYYINTHLNLRANWGYPIHKRIEPGVVQSNPTFNFSGVLTF